MWEPRTGSALRLSEEPIAIRREPSTGCASRLGRRIGEEPFPARREPLTALTGSSHRTGRDYNDEPLSLRRLRESLSDLEQLERQRNEIYNKQGTSTFGWDGIDGDLLGMRHHLRQPNVSPLRRYMSPSTGGHALGLSNRGSFERDPQDGSSFCSRQAPSPRKDGAGRLPTEPEAVTPWRSMLSSQSTAEPREAINTSSVALELEALRERVKVLEYERDEAIRKSERQDSEAQRLRRVAELAEAEHRALREDQQRELDKLRDVQRKHRAAEEEIEALKAELRQARETASDLRARVDHMMLSEKPGDVVAGVADSSLARPLPAALIANCEARDVSDALYACLRERTALIRFLIELVSTVQPMLFESSPSTSSARLGSARGDRRPAAKQASSSPSRDTPHMCVYDCRRHRHAGCYVCGGHGRTTRDASADTRGRQSVEDVDDDYHELGDLEELAELFQNEIKEAEHEHSLLSRKFAMEADKSARAIGITETEAAPLIRHLSELDVRCACLAWIEQQRQRREDRMVSLADSLVPVVDWSEERSRYQSSIRSTEAKFAQLARLKRVLKSRQSRGPVRKRAASRG